MTNKQYLVAISAARIVLFGVMLALWGFWPAVGICCAVISFEMLLRA
jgi:hypothetical protein